MWIFENNLARAIDVTELGSEINVCQTKSKTTRPSKVPAKEPLSGSIDEPGFLSLTNHCSTGSEWPRKIIRGFNHDLSFCVNETPLFVLCVVDLRSLPAHELGGPWTLSSIEPLARLVSGIGANVSETYQRHREQARRGSGTVANMAGQQRRARKERRTETRSSTKDYADAQDDDVNRRARKSVE
jgi:hypothetical protein